MLCISLRLARINAVVFNIATVDTFKGVKFYLYCWFEKVT